MSDSKAPIESGLLFGYRLRPDAPPEPVGLDAVDGPSGEGFVWIHLNLGIPSLAEWLAASPRLGDPARELLASRDPTTRIVTFASGLAACLADLKRELPGHGDGTATGILTLYCDRTLVITGRRAPMQTIETLRREVLDGRHCASAVAFVAALFRRLADTFSFLVTALGDEVDRLAEIVAMGDEALPIREVAALRVRIIRVRRQLHVGRHAVLRLTAHPPRWLQPEETALIRDSIETLAAVGDDLESTQERAKLLHEELGTGLAEATNRNLYLLSVIAAIFLPLTLITGIFGMNVGGLPWVRDGTGFLWVMLAMGGIGFLTAVVLRMLRVM